MGLPAAARAELLDEDELIELVEDIVDEVVVELPYDTEPEKDTAMALTEERRAAVERSVVFIANPSYGCWNEERVSKGRQSGAAVSGRNVSISSPIAGTSSRSRTAKEADTMSIQIRPKHRVSPSLASVKRHRNSFWKLRMVAKLPNAECVCRAEIRLKPSSGRRCYSRPPLTQSNSYERFSTRPAASWAKDGAAWM